MNDSRWHQLVSAIEGEDIEAMVNACEYLQNECDPSDVPRLLELLRHKNFVVREAAATPLAIVGGASCLCELFSAFQMGIDEGLDNDGLENSLIGLVELHPTDSRSKLMEIKNSSDPQFHEYADWLLEFC